MTLPTKRACFTDPPNRIHTFIGAGVRVDGDVACPGVIRVQGQIAGNVDCDAAADGSVILDASGSIAGAVGAGHVLVSGSVVGPVQSSRYCEVRPGASIIGDIEFCELVIRRGGIVDGAIKRSACEDGEQFAGEPRLPSANGEAEPSARPRWRPGWALAVVLAVVAAVWTERDVIVAAPSDMSEKANGLQNAAPAREGARALKVPETMAAGAAIGAGFPGANVSRQTFAPGEDAEEVVAISGINAKRPANVFLLVSNEPSVLYRRKRAETGDGARIAVAGGEKVSVAIGNDEQMRVAKGSNVEIFYQGRKVPADVIAKGSWMEFVPR